MQSRKISQLKSVVGNVAWLLAERGIQVALALIIGGLIARGFGPDLYGKWQYAISLLFIATTVTYLCGAEVIVPKLVHQPDDTGYILGTAFLIRSVASIAGFVLGQLAVFLWIKDEQVAAFTRILLVLLLFSEPFGVVVAWFQSRTYIAPVVKIRLLALALKALAVVVIFFGAMPEWLVAGAWVGEGVFVMVLLVFIYRKSTGSKWSVSRSGLRDYLREGATYWVGLLLMSVFMRMDRFFLAEYVGFNGLGLYSAAIQISENWFVLAAILSQSIAPKFIYVDMPRKQVDKNIVILLGLYVFLALAGSLVIAVLAPFIISVIFGPSYAGSVSLLQYTAFISVGVFVDSLFNVLMLREKAAMLVGMKWGAVLLSALSINYFFVSDLGLYAPILGLYVGYGVASLIGLAYWLHWRSKPQLERLV